MKTSGLGFIKIIIAVLSVFAVVVVGYQIYKYNFVSIKTESAVMGEMDEVVKANGIFFRNEKVISRSGYDYLDVVRAEGERIAAGGTIARVYSDERSAKVRKEIRQVEEKIATYEEVLEHSGSYQSAVSSIEQAIYADLSQITLSARKGRALDAFHRADDMQINLMKKKIASGDLVSYDTVLDDLRKELASLKSSAGSSVENLRTEESGYFSLMTDGLEDQLTLARLKDLTVENYDEVKSLAEKTMDSDSNLGKIVYDNSWTVAMKVKKDAVDRLEVNDTVYIKIPSYGTERIKCTVSDIRKSGEECILLLSSSVIHENILTLRQEEVQLIVKNYSGIVVRQSALRKVDGEDGVFVKVGLLLRYRKVHILYNNGTSAIVEYTPAENGTLRIYDQVVYKGSHLYDGKAVT